MKETWFKYFLKKYKLSFRKPLSRPTERVTAQDEISLKDFYIMLKEKYVELKIEPQNIWNMDESPFFWNLTSKKVKYFYQKKMRFLLYFFIIYRD